MADWSELPEELLRQISQRLLETPLYNLRFQSVCSSWRSSASNTSLIPHHSLSPSFSLSTRTLLLITPPSPHQRPWLIKCSHHPTRLYCPLSGVPFERQRFTLDLYSLPALHLANQFLLFPTCPNPLYIKKLVLLPSPKDRFSVLAINDFGKLALFKCGDPGWTIIPDRPTRYDDVCIYKGAFYAIGKTGRTVTVGLDSGLDLVAEQVLGGDQKFLVECEGELLLVDKYLFPLYFCTMDYNENGEQMSVCECAGEKTERFEVFRFDGREKRWVELRSLGDQVLFLGDDCAFSASAKDLRFGKGNCVVFRDDTFAVHGRGRSIGVFSLDDGRMSPLSDCPSSSELFWPPPDWVTLNT